MNIHGWIRGATQAGLVAAVSLCFAPRAIARSHVSVGIGVSVPGVSIGVGNCWRCGYWGAPPVYYAPAYYPPPVYYPAPAYHAPAPAYYGYGYYAPYYPRYHDRRGHHRSYYRGDSYRHGHH